MNRVGRGESITFKTQTRSELNLDKEPIPPSNPIMPPPNPLQIGVNRVGFRLNPTHCHPYFVATFVLYLCGRKDAHVFMHDFYLIFFGIFI